MTKITQHAHTHTNTHTVNIQNTRAPPSLTETTTTKIELADHKGAPDIKYQRSDKERQKRHQNNTETIQTIYNQE